MGRGGDHSINLTGSFAGPVTVAGRDVRKNRQQQVQAREDTVVLGAITTLLASDEIPWQRQDVAAARPVLEEAVRRGRLGPSARQALLTVRNSVSAAVWAGIIGNLAYEPIKAFLGM